MSLARPEDSADRVLIVIPNWVGDVVLATPALAALRARFASATISLLCRGYVGDVLAGGGWGDEVLHWPAGKGLRREWAWLRFARTLRAARFDLAILLTNSFRSALAVWLAGVPRRVGFARDGRGWMLTHKLWPLKQDGRFVPASVHESYLDLAAAVGAAPDSEALRLGVTPEQEAAADQLKHHYGLDRGGAYAVINPGAAFGAAKCWLPERFAEVCDGLADRFGLRSVLVGAAGEAELLRQIADRARADVTCCTSPGTTLGSLKALVRDAALLVCNDTGPRHYGIAFDVPTVTVFGPTHQAWTDVPGANEQRLQVPVPCGPCQLRTCPLDHRCMTSVSSAMVLGAAERLLRQRGVLPVRAEASCG